MLLYIPSTQGNLFKTPNDNFIRSFSGNKLKYISDTNEERLLVEKDLEEMVFAEKKLPENFKDFKTDKTVYKLWYPNDRIVYLVEIENEE